MKKIITEITDGAIGIRAACLKYGLNRNTLKLWMTRLSIRNLSDQKNVWISSSMEEEQNNRDLASQIKQLTKSLEYARIKILGLETMIKVAEEDLHIKIRKKPGTKQSRESGRVTQRLD